MLVLLSATAVAADDAGRRCAAIADDAERLACYDAAGDEPDAVASSYLGRLWGLDGRALRFKPWPHRPNSILPGRWTNDAHQQPFEEAAPAGASDLDVQSFEAKFQVSFKTKLFDRLLGGPGDVWFGYTQQSHFQVYNNSASRPFRETDFEPEVIVSFPLRRRMAGWSWRVVAAGLVHQSNGRSEPLSRSWNRLYAIVGVERGRTAVHLKPWIRIDSTNEADDDNPGITDLVGRLELSVVQHIDRHVLSFRGRSNLDAGGHHGSAQIDWFVPVTSRVRAHLQVFSGYGESLIDYDHRQTVLAAGVLLFDPF